MSHVCQRYNPKCDYSYRLVESVALPSPVFTKNRKFQAILCADLLYRILARSENQRRMLGWEFTCASK